MQTYGTAGPPGIAGPYGPPLYPPPFPAPASKVAPYVGNVGYAGKNSATSITFGVNANAGDGLVIFVGESSSTTITASDGASFYQTSPISVTEGGVLKVVWCQNLKVTNPTITLTTSSVAWVVTWVQIVGANSGFFIDGMTAATAATGSVTPVCHTTSPNDLILCGAITGTPASASTFGTGFSNSVVLVESILGYGSNVGWANATQPLGTKGPTATNGSQANVGAITVMIRTASVSQYSAPPPTQIPGAITYAPGYFAPPPASGGVMPVSSGVNENLTEQTATFTEGTPTYEVDYFPTEQTATFTEGTLTDTVGYALTEQTATFTEGTITPEADYALTSQTATFTEGTIPPEFDYFPSEQTGTFAEGTITTTVGGDVTVNFGPGITATLGEGTVTISGEDIPNLNQGGTGRPRRKVRLSSEIFTEEMAKLEKRAEVATAQREDVEKHLSEMPADPWQVSADHLRYIVNFERALRRAQEREKRELPIEVPVYLRIPAKSEGVKRVEAHQRLQSLVKVARHREQIAQELLRKVRERIDVEAATALMQFLMWED